LSISRKHFVAAAALGAAGAALEKNSGQAAAQTAKPHLHVLRPDEYDHARLLRTIATDRPHKQVFQSANPLLALGAASIYLHMQNGMNAFEFSYGMGPDKLATLAVFTGRSIVFALRDEMWSKYGFGTAFGLAPTNVYYRAGSLRETGNPDDPDSIYQDWSAEAVLHRGGAFMLCHNALTTQATLLSSKIGAPTADILADFKRNVLSGFQIVPAGVAATQLAIERGWKPYSIL
jgi:hypothetical protein